MFFTIFFAACNTGKYIPHEEFLLIENKIHITDSDVKKEEIKSNIKQTPNKKIFGFRFHLWLYRLSNPDNNNKFNNWLRKIGEEPVIFDENMVYRSLNQIERYMEIKGYYERKVTDSIVYEKNKARVNYSIIPGNPLKVKNIYYVVEDTSISFLILSDTLNSLLSPGMNFDLTILQSERERIEKYMKNYGYYDFSEDYIEFEADTFSHGNEVRLTMFVKPYLERNNYGNIVPVPHKQFYIEKVNVYPDLTRAIKFNNSDTTSYEKPDTVSIKDIHIIYTSTENRIKPSIIVNSNFIYPGRTYNTENVQQTYLHLASLKLFKQTNISFHKGEKSPEDTLNAYPLIGDIRLVPSKNQSYSIEMEGTTSGGNLGLGGNISYQHKNIFGGAELLNMSLKGAYEFVQKGDYTFGDLYEFTAETKLQVPKFLLPVKASYFNRNFAPKTVFSLSYNYQVQPFYQGQIINFSFGYNWKGQKNIIHSVNPVEVNDVNSTIRDEDFKQYLARNPYLRSSYEPHLLTLTSYTFIYNTQIFSSRNHDYTYFRFNSEIAGYISYLWDTFVNDNETGLERALNKKRAEYFKFDIDFRKARESNDLDYTVMRFFAGIGIPYDQSAIPFEKRYFGGGANGVRAWNLWSLGPGSYSIDSVLFQAGDIKLELNLEYRFKFIWKFEGALFTDIGNIWNMNSSRNNVDIQEDEDFQKNIVSGDFQFQRFYKELAVGAGIGLRLDLSFFVVRLDMGVKLHDPSDIEGKRWIPVNRAFQKDDIALHLAIGYPF